MYDIEKIITVVKEPKVQRFVEFELNFVPLGTGRYRVLASSQYGDGQYDFAFPDDAAMIPGTTHTFGVALSELRRERPFTDELLLNGFGELLWDLVFQRSVANVYAAAQGALGGANDAALRLKLSIPESEMALAALPWELLKAPADLAALALDGASIVRYLPQQAATPSVAAQLPLRVLLTCAQTPPAIDAAQELAAVRESLAALEQQGLVTITVEEHLTVRTLQRRIGEGYDVWHFVGHGAPALDGRGMALRFEDDQGDAKTVAASQVGVLLARSNVRLAVISACNSASVAAIETARGVAPALIKARVPAVVAMQFTAPESATREFNREFYYALARGEPIDACVTEGRKAVYFNNTPDEMDWAIPAVYTRATDGVLFRLPEKPAAQPKPATPPPATVPAAKSAPAAPPPDATQTTRTAIEQLHTRITTEQSTLADLQNQAVLLGPHTTVYITQLLRTLRASLPQLYTRLVGLYDELLVANPPDAADLKPLRVTALIRGKEMQVEALRERAAQVGPQFGKESAQQADALEQEIAALRAEGA